MNKSWSDTAVSSTYINSIDENNDNEINLTKRNYHDPYFLSLLPELVGKNILDIGCGEGYLLRELKKRSKNCLFTGTDLENMLKLIENGTEENDISYIPADCHKLPFSENSVDLAISSLMLHWTDDLKGTCREINRILKPGGKFVISTINPRIFHVGKWTNLDTDNPQYTIDKDISKPQELEVYLNKTIGPLTYYMRPREYYYQTLEETGLVDIKMHEPLITNAKTLLEFPQLKKYGKYPLYLFITGTKPRWS